MPATIDINLKLSILRVLKHGEANAITGKYLAIILGEKGTRQIRLAIVELRHEFHPIIGGHKGYYIAETLEEIQKARKYVLSYVYDLCIYLRDLKYMAKNFSGQLKLDLKET